MTLEDYNIYLQKAKQLKVGMITFLGGEPMLWKPLYEAISQTADNSILTDLTTNGLLLNTSTIEMLGESGLDYLNISVDGMKPNEITKKNSIIRNGIINGLKEAKKKFRMHFRLNSVIYKNNFGDIAQLIEFSKEQNVQLSLGYIVPPIDGEQQSDHDIYFDKQDTDDLRKIVSYILNKKKCGYPIIDPNSYFENIFRFLNREKFWDCNYPTRYGWINVTPNGKIRSCTKKMDEMDIRFIDLNKKNYKKLRDVFKVKVEECNLNCYSNCAYDSYFYTHNKLHMIKKIIDRIQYNLLKPGKANSSGVKNTHA
jgi:MoaA/NifB/PqqE/SkfB family radical SAM enzyme